MSTAFDSADGSDRLDQFQAPRRVVVVIHPEARQRDALGRHLSSFYEIADYPDIESAVVRTRQVPAAVLLGDAAIDRGQGVTVGKLKSESRFDRVPIILCTWARAAHGLGGDVDAVVDVSAANLDLIALIANLVDRRVEERWARLAPAPREALRRTLDAFEGIGELIATGGALDYHNVTQACAPVLDAVKQSAHLQVFEGLANHNSFVYVHSLRVSTLLVLFGYTMGLSDDELTTLATAGLMHDLGKTAMPTQLLNKVSPLDPTERLRMREHVELTMRFLKRNPDVPHAVLAIAAQHHERLDGTGYPAGLKGDALNDLVRMAAIVDVFAALTERRTYREPLSPIQALAVMTDNIAEKFDQRLLAAFRAVLVGVTAERA